jgi:Sec-independent protein translocase protein TatA
VVFWRIVEVVIAVALILIFSTEIFITLWRGTKLFTGIRRRKLDDQMKEIKEEIEKEEVEKEIEEETKKLKKNREEKKNEGVGQQQPAENGSGENQKGS